MKFVSLMYHNVRATDAQNGGLSPSVTSYFTTPELFAAHLAEIKSAGARCMDFAELEKFYAAGAQPAGAFPVLLTFDDGWRGCLEIAAPILEKHQASAMLFVTTDFIGRPLFVDRGDLQHLPASLRIGSHARSHRLLAELSTAEIAAELRDSKRKLEEITGSTVDALSIPGGAIDSRVRRIAVETGYRYLFTSDVHLNSVRRGPHFIGRVPIRFNTPAAAVRRYVTQSFASERIRHQVLQWPKRLLGRPLYGKVRRLLLREKPGQQDMLELRAAPLPNQE